MEDIEATFEASRQSKFLRVVGDCLARASALARPTGIVAAKLAVTSTHSPSNRNSLVAAHCREESPPCRCRPRLRGPPAFGTVGVRRHFFSVTAIWPISSLESCASCLSPGRPGQPAMYWASRAGYRVDSQLERLCAGWLSRVLKLPKTVAGRKVDLHRLAFRQ